LPIVHADQAYFDLPGGSSASVGNAAVSDLGFQAGNISAIAAHMTVASVNLTATDPDSRSRARLAGIFYNDGSGGGADKTGDVVAEIGIDGTEVFYGVLRCADAGCASTTFLTDGWVSMLPVNLNEPHGLHVAWDATAGAEKFIFQMDDNPPYTYSPATAVNAPAHDGMTGQFVVGTALRLAGGESGDVIARIDNVRTDVTPP
jgi:hypothetical protein